tara:strand:- start:59 stop:424 length:366 start_codon:yes stop_codon:yes gene_type:complete
MVEELFIKFKGNPYIADVVEPPYLLTIIPFNKIYWSKKYFPEYIRNERCKCCGGSRYRSTDIRFPCIVTPYPINSYGEIYRLIDGSHRIQKMIDQGLNEGLFFIIDGDNTTQSSGYTSDIL